MVALSNHLQRWSRIFVVLFWALEIMLLRFNPPQIKGNLVLSEVWSEKICQGPSINPWCRRKKLEWIEGVSGSGCYTCEETGTFLRECTVGHKPGRITMCA